MIKNLKQGFSLAEILIALLIVSIIATMGFSIAQKGLESAYRLYYYTGYNGMQLAINDAYEEVYTNGTPYESDPNSEFSEEEQLENEINERTEDFLKHIKMTLSLKKDCNPVNNSPEYTNDGCEAPNHIEYSFYTIKNGSLATPPDYRITMQVPSVTTTKKVSGNSKILNKSTILLYYYPSLNYNYLIPVTKTGFSTANIDLNFNFIKNIEDRKDLLPFYIDDYQEGRQKKIYNTETGKIETEPYNPRTFYSFREAFCTSLETIVDTEIGHEDSDIGKLEIKCSDYSGKSTRRGVLKVIDPRKVF